LEVVEAAAQGIMGDRQLQPLRYGCKQAGHFDILAEAVAKLGRFEVE
jgi:hypothetical protein